MTIVKSRAQYYETGLEVLGDLGYAGFRLAEVCRRLGVTTGSFYHRFASWPAYTHELARYWAEHYTTALVMSVWQEPDPHRRLEQLAETMAQIPHRVEAAIRTWSAVDDEVYELFAEVDRKRFETIRDVLLEILPDRRVAELFASFSSYLRVGYQRAYLPADPDALRWAVNELLGVFYSDRYAGGHRR